MNMITKYKCSKQPSPMATYQDGHFWRKTLNECTHWMLILNVLIHMTEVAKKQEMNRCMCWMTLPEVHPIAHNTSCPEYCKCKQIEHIIGLYACADLLYTKVLVHFRWDYVTTASSYIAGYLNKAIWNLRNLCKAIFCPTQICGKILCMFLLEILKIEDPLLLDVINLNI